MSRVRAGMGKDRVVRTLGGILLSVPLATAIALGSLASGRDHLRVSAPPVPTPKIVDAKPILTRTVVRPSFVVPQTPPPESSEMVRIAFAAEAATANARVVESLTTGSVRQRSRTVLPREARAWRMEVLRDVHVAEGLKLASTSGSIVLAGVEPLPGSCRRLDGREEACSARAATRLELLTRDREITCRVFDASPGEEPAGQCKADKIDLAEDLTRNGLVRRLPPKDDL